MIEKEKLKDYANKLMFDMDDSEYSVLQDENLKVIKSVNDVKKDDKLNVILSDGKINVVVE